MHLQIDHVIPFMGEAPVSLYISEGKFVAGPSGVESAGSESAWGVSSVHGATASGSAHLRLDLPGVLALPGLINSHDHLEFNCFPSLGDRHHLDYVAWGKDIHARYKPEIDAVLRIPAEGRALWGVYKNLLGGVTTVVQHGLRWGMGDLAPRGSAHTPIRVVETTQSIHSVGLEAHWKRRLNNPRRWKQPCVIHIGEGVNEIAAVEVERLLRWNLLKRRLIGVHGIAMTPAQASRFQALVWCPASNYFLYGKTAEVNRLGKNTSLLFGTDSTLTGSWDMWEHIRIALQTEMSSEAELLESLTTKAAEVWDLPTGRLTPGYDADLVLMRAAGTRPVDPGAEPRGLHQLYSEDIDPGARPYGLHPLSSQDILLVLSRGNPVLVDESLFPVMAREGFSFDSWSAVKLAKNVKYVQGDLPALMAQIHQFDPSVQFPVEAVVPYPNAAGAGPLTPSPQTAP